MIDNIWLSILILEKKQEARLIDGYALLLSHPIELLDEQGRIEVLEARDWSINRHRHLSAAIDAITDLLDDGYPNREQQVAPQSVIDQLRAAQESLDAAIDEFITPVVINVDVQIESA